MRRQTLRHIHDAAEADGSTAAIVNCSGLQARFLGGVEDQKVFATRGQTVLVRAPHFKKILTHQGASIRPTNLWRLKLLTFVQ